MHIYTTQCTHTTQYTPIYPPPHSTHTGEDGDSIQPTVQRLHAHGIGSILDYAAEDDVTAPQPTASRMEPHDTVVARTYAYEDEAACDRHAQVRGCLYTYVHTYIFTHTHTYPHMHIIQTYTFTVLIIHYILTIYVFTIHIHNTFYSLHYPPTLGFHSSN